MKIDTFIVSLLSSEESDHGPVVDDFVFWCDRAFLQLNVEKTKDMLIDFRRKSSTPQNTTINGQMVGFVETYKYLSSLIDNKLKFN